jgi:hypothetical protein
MAVLLSKMNILRDEGQGPSFISVHHFVYLLARWRHTGSGKKSLKCSRWYTF